MPTPGFPLPLRNALAELAIAAFGDADARAALDWLARPEGAPPAGAGERLAAVHLVDRGTASLLAVHAPYAVAAAAHAARVGRAVATAGPAPQDPLARVTWMARALWNERLFFEVHEVLEAVWKTATGTTRGALQGVIQVAVAYHHAAHKNLRGARKLLVEGRQRIAATAPDALPGLDLATLYADTATWEHAFTSGDVPTTPPPQLRGR